MGIQPSGSDSSFSASASEVEELVHPETELRVREKREAVSAPVTTGAKEFKPPFYEKTPAETARLTKVLRECFLFASLDEDDLSVLVGAFKEHRCNQGDMLIEQGNEGDCLYVVEEGEFDVFKILKPGDPPTHVNIMKPGQVVGELALMYCAPRAATVIAKQDGCRLWRLDSDTFTNLVKGAAMRRRERYLEFLSKVPDLKVLDDYQRAQVSDALIPVDFRQDDVVVREGEEGDCFFFLSKGKAVALKNNEVVMEYHPGDYFGELALRHNEPRAATVKIVDGPGICLKLERISFNRLLGPLEHLMQQQAERYSDVPLRERVKAARA